MEEARFYEYRGPDGRVIAHIRCQGTPDMERIKKASERFLKRKYQEEARKKQKV